MFGKMYLGLPRLKFLMMLSCDSMDDASDLPTGSDEMQGWLSSTWGLHVIAGFSGENHVMAAETTTTMDSFISDQKTQGIGHAWMNHFTYFSIFGNNTTVGASNCAVAMMLGNTVSDAASRWNETINSPNAMPNPAYPTAVAMRGYYCGCCSDYGGAEGAHCTPSC
jgi:hypothetical protein